MCFAYIHSVKFASLRSNSNLNFFFQKANLSPFHLEHFYSDLCKHFYFGLWLTSIKAQIQDLCLFDLSIWGHQFVFCFSCDNSWDDCTNSIEPLFELFFNFVLFHFTWFNRRLTLFSCLLVDCLTILSDSKSVNHHHSDSLLQFVLDLVDYISPLPHVHQFSRLTLQIHYGEWASLNLSLSLSLRCQPMCDIECHSSPHLIWDYGPPLLCSLTRLTTAIGREFFHSLSSDLKNMEHFLTWKNVAATLVLCNSPFGPDSSLARASSDSLSSVFFFSPQCATCTRHLQCDDNSAQLCP